MPIVVSGFGFYNNQAIQQLTYDLASDTLEIAADVDLKGNDLTDSTGGGSVNVPQLLTAEAFNTTSIPALWKEMNGDEDSAGAGVSYAAAGCTLATRDAQDYKTGIVYAPVGICRPHQSSSYVATVEFDNFDVDAYITGANNWLLAIGHYDGPIPHGALAEVLLWYDPDGGAGAKWQVYKTLRVSGDVALNDSAPANLGDTEPTGLRLRLDWTEAGYEAYYDVDTGGGFSESFTEIGSGRFNISKSAGDTSEVSPPAIGQRSFGIIAAQNQATGSDATVRIKASSMTVT